MSVGMSLWIVGGIWAVCIVVTGLLSLVSPIYLMSAGTYCFFGFKSAGIAGWLVPGLVLALGVMTFCYVQIFRTAKHSAFVTTMQINRVKTGDSTPRFKSPSHERKPTSHEVTPQVLEESNFISDSPTDPTGPTGPTGSTDQTGVKQTSAERSGSFGPGGRSGSNNSGDNVPMKVAKRSALFVIVLLVGWGFAAVTTIYEFTVGLSTEMLVTGVGVGGVLHSIWVPLTYAYTSVFHKTTMFKLATCQCIVKCRRRAGKWELLWCRPIINRRGHLVQSIIATVAAEQNSAKPFVNDESSNPTHPKQNTLVSDKIVVGGGTASLKIVIHSARAARDHTDAKDPNGKDGTKASTPSGTSGVSAGTLTPSNHATTVTSSSSPSSFPSNQMIDSV